MSYIASKSQLTNVVENMKVNPSENNLEKPSNIKKENPAIADKASRDFEAYFVQYMLKEMRKTISRSDLFGSTDSMQIFEELFDESLSKEIAMKGQGIGLANQIRKHLLGDESLSANIPDSARLPIYPYMGENPYGIPTNLKQKSNANLFEAGYTHFDNMSSSYGDRINPISGNSQFHAGVDIAVPEGTPVFPAGNGKVVFAGAQRGYGNIVIVDHGNGYTTRYAHNSKLLVSEGEQINTRTVIAESGSTGNSTGPHLHFEVRKDGVPIDPTTVRIAKVPSTIK